MQMFSTRFLLLLFISLTTTVCSGKAIELPEVSIPQLPDAGARVQDFVPQGWGIELSETGDLGGDGSLMDHLVLLQMQDTRNIFHHEGGCTLDTNPRILAFLLAREGHYVLAGQNGTLIPRPDQFCDGNDPITGVVDGGISIGGEHGREGTIELGFFYSTLGHISFSFAWLDDGRGDGTSHDVYLLKRVHDSMSRLDLSRQVIQVDYLKQRVTCLEYDDEEDQNRITSEHTRPFISEKGPQTPLLRLAEVGNAFEFEWTCALED